MTYTQYSCAQMRHSKLEWGVISQNMVNQI